MPDQSFWESLFDIPAILDGLQVDDSIGDAAEVGCGYGTFTLPVAARIRGTLHAFDIEAAMIETTQARVVGSKADNVRLRLCDVLVDGFGLPTQSMDAVFLFNILHAENPTALLAASARLLRPGGRVLAIHWRSDIATPRGPDLSIRPRPTQIAAWAQDVGLTPEPSRLLPPWHFGLVLRR
ncbi:class I SAM-dependent methyltransferase [Opitutus terrae]|uniref:Methyltransferase type 12 n=1 Tax=Opitutus terrae (strain DSM 11246 / JCM 15787 / PB90-1) TaxID=452637 RepID=B1ZQ08_OPITP|nr:Methyltransferase type 12 [Opitutus terrae PB90-1]